MIKFDLYDAVEELKSNRIISKDIDIANKTGYSRQIVSNYLTGKQKPSKAFINKFLDTFSMHLNTETPLFLLLVLVWLIVKSRFYLFQPLSAEIKMCFSVFLIPQYSSFPV